MYTPEQRKEIKRRLILSSFWLGFDLASFLVLLIISLCLTNYQNHLFFEIVGGVSTPGFAFFAILLLAKLKDSRRYLLHFDSVLAEKGKELEAEVASIAKKPITLDDSMRVREVSLKQDGETRVYYLLDAFFPNRLEEGKTYSFLLADRFIRGIEE